MVNLSRYIDHMSPVMKMWTRCCCNLGLPDAFQSESDDEPTWSILEESIEDSEMRRRVVAALSFLKVV